MTSPEILLLFECDHLRPNMALPCFSFIILLFLFCSASIESVLFPFSCLQSFICHYVLLLRLYFVHLVHIWDKTFLWMLHSIFSKRNLFMQAIQKSLLKIITAAETCVCAALYPCTPLLWIGFYDSV